MSEKEIIMLDFTGCNYIHDIHIRIKEAFDFPDYYGKNWDALWDLISEPFNPTFVIIRGTKCLPKDLQPVVPIIMEIVKENKEWQKRWKRDFDFVVES